MIEALVKTQVVSIYILTLSLSNLPRRHSVNDKQKCQMWNQYGLFSPSPEQVKGFFLIKIHSIESGFVIGPWNVPFAGVYVCIFQPGNFTGRGSKGVNSPDCVHQHVRCDRFFSFYFSPIRVLLADYVQRRLNNFPCTVSDKLISIWLIMNENRRHAWLDQLRCGQSVSGTDGIMHQVKYFVHI